MTETNVGRPPGHDSPANRPNALITTAVAPAERHTTAMTVPRDGDYAADLRVLMDERHEAWQAGVLEGFAFGWTQGLSAGLERGAA